MVRTTGTAPSGPPGGSGATLAESPRVEHHAGHPAPVPAKRGTLPISCSVCVCAVFAERGSVERGLSVSPTSAVQGACRCNSEERITWYMWMDTCERERERKTERQRDGEREKLCVNVCVCVYFKGVRKVVC